MRVSYAFLLAISSALAIPIPSTYTWSFTRWSGSWYGIGWANFVLDAPQATVSGITIPAISFTTRCSIAGAGGVTQDCNSVIAGDRAGRTLEFTLRPFDNSLQQVQLDGVYKFTYNGKNYAVDAHISQQAAPGERSATIVPTALREV
ncbi:hypothetical protein BKA66DRAFT_462507 [Pyrenochaeta sp. MPI-SDFR-AT-0127]|nr:hypothetical protein BKA66DRAFT_462507 [Pyrenochaeta sp. MPI-SDFR-AT-0127]